ncbi:MAG: hypothetical protein K6G25_08815 [Bacteroidales bacterium]|nr:hypothetical protein [Bacteroidales bacterium]
MNKMRKKKKTLVFSLLVAAGMLLSTNLSAQEQSRSGGLFGEPSSTPSNGMMGRGSSSVGGDLIGQGFGATNGDITGQTFGDDALLGSGLFVLLAAGAGYASIKSRKKQNKQNRKEN